MTTMIVNTTKWDGKKSVECLVVVLVDDRVVDGTVDAPDSYAIDAAAKKVTIRVRPIPDDFSGADVILERQDDGSLKTTSLAGAAAVDVTPIIKGMFVNLKISIRLLQIRDATADFVAAFDTSVNPQIQPAVLPPGTDARIAGYFAALNATDNINRTLIGAGNSPVQIGAHTLTLLEQSPVILDVVAAASGRLGVMDSVGIEPKNDTFVVEVAGSSSRIPMTIAVSWPQDLPPDQPAPMFVFYRHAPWQESFPAMGKFLRDSIRGYPYSFDYACYGLLENLWFPMRPHMAPYSRGLPYQILAAGKKVVTVVACPKALPPSQPATPPPATPAPTQFGRWIEPQYVQDMLIQIQMLYAASKGKQGAATLGRVALGAFSSGNYYLGQLLKNGTHLFVTDTVKEIYLFGPDSHVLMAMIPYVTAWQSSPGGGSRMVRLYNSLVMAEQKTLLPSVKTTTPFFVDSADTFTTVSAVTERDWVRAIQSATPPLVPALTAAWNGMDSHFATSAFMLTHAMSRSGF
jgi:hypothetical protein